MLASAGWRGEGLTVEVDSGIIPNNCLGANEVAVGGDELVARRHKAHLDQVLELHPVLRLGLRVDDLSPVALRDRPHLPQGGRSEERRVGKECVSTYRSR